MCLVPKRFVSMKYVHNLSYQGVEHSIVVFFDEDILCGQTDSDEFHIVAGKLPVGIFCRQPFQVVMQGIPC